MSGKIKWLLNSFTDSDLGEKLDWYIVKKFLGTYVFMIAVVMSISIIFDVSEKLKDFMSPENNLTFLKLLVITILTFLFIMLIYFLHH